MTVRAPSIRSIAIIGAGIVGLSCALELADRGVRVTLYDKQWPPRGASRAAAGMLAPAFEAIGAADHHPNLFEFCDTSAGLWPDWADRLEKRAQMPSGYHSGPTLAVAFTEAEVEKLKAVRATLSNHPLAPKACLADLHAIEQTVAGHVLAALLLPSDGQVDNRRTMDALVCCVEQHELIKIETESAPLKWSAGGLDHAGHQATLVTAGWQSGAVMVQRNSALVDIRELEPVLGDVQPIGGQMLAVEAIENGPRSTIRAGHLYIVPKSDRIIIGATSEPGRVLDQPKSEQIAELRARAIEICPVLAQANILESWAGVRPGLPNHAPLLGETRVENLFVASGHYRNGILLAPITAQIMGDLIVDGRRDALATKFAPGAELTEQV